MNNEEQKVLQKHLARFIISDVYNTITEDDIIKITAPNVWMHKGNKLTPGQVVALRNEAKAFLESGLWKILKAELLWLAKSGYSKSKTESDLIAVKLLELLTKALEDALRKMIE